MPDNARKRQQELEEILKLYRMEGEANWYRGIMHIQLYRDHVLRQLDCNSPMRLVPGFESYAHAMRNIDG